MATNADLVSFIDFLAIPRDAIRMASDSTKIWVFNAS